MHHVYAHLDTAGEIVYVGCTGRPARRSGEHAVRSAWWPTVAMVAPLACFTERAAALAFEAALVSLIQPAHNRVHAQTASPAEVDPFASGSARARALLRLADTSTHLGSHLCEVA